MKKSFSNIAASAFAIAVALQPYNGLKAAEVEIVQPLSPDMFKIDPSNIPSLPDDLERGIVQGIDQEAEDLLRWKTQCMESDVAKIIADWFKDHGLAVNVRPSPDNKKQLGMDWFTIKPTDQRNGEIFNNLLESYYEGLGAGPVPPENIPPQNLDAACAQRKLSPLSENIRGVVPASLSVVWEVRPTVRQPLLTLQLG